MNSRGVMWNFIIVFFGLALLIAAMSPIVAHGDAIFPQNPDEAADMLGDGDGTRSGNPEQWITDCGDWCVHLKSGEPTKVHLDDCAWAKIYTEGQNVEVWGPWADMVEEASVYRDWSCEAGQEPDPDPDPFPPVPVGPPLTEWPKTAADAAWAFSPEGMQTIVESEVMACNNNAGDCWRLKFTEARPVAVRIGALGQIGESQFVTNTGLWVQDITMWADWQNLPKSPDPEPDPDPDPQPQQCAPKPAMPQPLEFFPRTVDHAAVYFGVQGCRSADPAQWELCNNGNGCAHFKHGEGSWVLVPKGSFVQYWDGETKEVYGPQVVFAGEGTMWADWPNIPPEEDPDPDPEPPVDGDILFLYLPAIRTPQIVPNPPLTEFPQTKEEAAEHFGYSGERSSDPGQWSQCDNWQPGQFVSCWHLADGTETLVPLPKGAWIQGRNAQGSFEHRGPHTERWAEASVRAQWEDIPN